MRFPDFTLIGAWVFIPIILIALFVVYVFIERSFIIRRANINDESYINRVREFIHERKIEAAIRLSQSTNTPVSRMIEVGILRIGRPMADVYAALENIGKLETFKLQRGMPALRTSVIAAPLLGLLGTVLGMMEAFGDPSLSGSTPHIGNLAGSLYASLAYTAAGLAVGIPALLFYLVLVSKIKKAVIVLETRSSEFMALLNEPAKK